MTLSERLSKVADFVTEGYRLADIGTDHGYIPIWLVNEGKIPNALAMDIGEGPLEKAKEHIAMYGLEEKIETRLSDGLDKLNPGEVDSVLIAGMGGALVVRILDKATEVLADVKELVLSPHTEVFLVRHYLLDNGYEITREEMVKDMGKYYTVIKAVHGDNKEQKELYDRDENNYIYGLINIREKKPVFLEFLQNERRKCTEVLENLKNSKDSETRRAEIREKIAVIDRIINN